MWQFLDNNPIIASPDGIATCKCISKILFEIKCLYNIKNKTMADGIKEFQFLVEKDRLFLYQKRVSIIH